VKILYLTNPKVENLNLLPEFMRKCGDQVEIFYDKINISFVNKLKTEFIVSDRYEFLIKEEVIRNLKGNIINLHPSILPWNKGYHSNFWSIYYDTPKGNSIHYVDKGIDTGDIACQNEVFFENNDTLRTTYYKLRENMLELFFQNWTYIKKNNVERKKQSAKDGSLHYKKEFNNFFKKLPNGWDTNIQVIRNLKNDLR
tara:strand:+ start:80 stop:673 length:594 start_codon:yes stop_codon:yes gene_type:complete